MEPWSANQTTTLLTPCPGNSTRCTNTAQLLNQTRHYNHLIPFAPPPLSDVANVIGACYGQTPPPIVLIGHGVGGAIAVHAASNMLLPSTVGLVAIDVVEGESSLFLKVCHVHEYLPHSSSFPAAGSATEALHNMQTFLKARPKSFKSMDHAIEWRRVLELHHTYASLQWPEHLADRKKVKKVQMRLMPCASCQTKTQERKN